MATTATTASAAARGAAPGSEEPVAVANRLRPILLLLNRHLRGETHALGVSGGQVTLLATIRDRPGIGVGELAARERVSPPSMSATIDRLEAAGLVTRSREQATDRRRVGLTATADGLRVLRAVKSRRTAWLAKRLRALSPAERAAVDAAVDPLARLLDSEK